MHLTKSDDEREEEAPRISMKKYHTYDPRDSRAKHNFSNPASKNFVNQMRLEIVYNQVTKGVVE